MPSPSRPTRVWITAPAAGGRSGFAAHLVRAFSSAGCAARDMSLSVLAQDLPASLAASERGKEILTTFWKTLRAEPPELLLDLSPLPTELVDAVRNAGIRTAYWLLENALDPAYDYWKDSAPHYDLFFSFQGPPFESPGCRYLPWGATAFLDPADRDPSHVVLHGAASPARAAFLADFCRALPASLPPVKVIGPGWLRAAQNADFSGRIEIENRWTPPEETAALLGGQVALVPLSHRINAIAPRVWDSIAAGACVIAESVPLLGSHLEPGREIFAVGSGAEAARIAAELIADPSRARAVIAAGRERVRREHTLAARCRVLLDAAGLGASRP